MLQRSTQLSLLAVVMLVALRLSVGWHFYKEGTKKYHDPSFSSAGFFRAAKGPLAGFYHDLAGDDAHGFDQLLAQPLAAEATASKSGAAADGDDDQPAEKSPAADAKPTAGEIPADAPYKEWAEQIKKDWRTGLQKFVDRHSFSPEQKDAATKVFDTRRQQLTDFLAEETDEIKTYRHELSRLKRMVEDETATDLPFQRLRIAQKRAEVAAKAHGWKNEVKGFEKSLDADLNQLLTKEQLAVAAPAPRTRLEMIDHSVAYLHMGIGVCLLLGLFSRLAGFAAAMFLLSVIATQPPWVAGAEPVYYQMVEFCAAMVLATIPTGRFAGLDFVLGSIFGCCRTQGK